MWAGKDRLKEMLKKTNLSRTLAAFLAGALALGLTACGSVKTSYSENTDNAAAKQTAQLNSAIIKTMTTEQGGTRTTPDYVTTYEIFPYSFADSDGDGIGDLQGIISKLDYISDGIPSTTDDLNCNAIWLTPVCPSTTYHKYDITDYENIDPDFGTLDDYREFVAECHKRGISVIFDMVMNHTSSQHPWFTEAKSYLIKHPDIDFENPDQVAAAVAECPYVGYYNYSSKAADGYNVLMGTKYYYECRFWSEMPDLNLDSDAVKSEFSDIIKFWTDIGVDGFRMDAATSYYTGNTNQNIETLKWFKAEAQKYNPKAYVVAEVWTGQSTYAKYYQSGIDSCFDFAFSQQDGAIANITRGTEEAGLFTRAMAAEEKLYKEQNEASGTDYSSETGRPDVLNAPFYTNHDTNRSAGYYTGDNAAAQVKFAGGLNLLMSGNAYIYYGEELGMKGSGKDENKRSPMLWAADAETDPALCKGPSDMDSFEQTCNTEDIQKKDAASNLAYFRQASFLRTAFPVLSRGETADLPTVSEANAATAAFTRTDTEGGLPPVTVVINSGAESAEVSMKDLGDESLTLSAVLLTGEDAVSVKGGTITMPAYSVAVFTTGE